MKTIRPPVLRFWGGSIVIKKDRCIFSPILRFCGSWLSKKPGGSPEDDWGLGNSGEHSGLGSSNSKERPCLGLDNSGWASAVALFTWFSPPAVALRLFIAYCNRRNP